MIDATYIDTRIERRINYTQSLLAVLLVVVIAVPFVFTLWYARSMDIIRDVELSDMTIVGESQLCPGDMLTTRHHFAAKGSGLLVVDATLWRMTPPMTIVFSEARRFVLEDDFDRTVYRGYEIPATYIDERTQLPVELEPGQYKRILAVSSPTRSGIFDKESVLFTVKPQEECK